MRSLGNENVRVALTFNLFFYFGVVRIALTKLDIFDGLDELKIGVSYHMDGKELVSPPGNTADLHKVVVTYLTLPGWKQNISKCRRFEELPKQAQEYVRTVEKVCEIPSKSTLGKQLSLVN